METQDFAFGFMLRILSSCEGDLSSLLPPPAGIWFSSAVLEEEAAAAVVAAVNISGVFGNSALVFKKAVEVAAR